jgi:DHA2 family multidrug resistance protein
MFTSHGSSAADAHLQALALLNSTISRQASVLSFNDTFWVTAILVLVFLPLVFLLGRPQRGTDLAGAH